MNSEFLVALVETISSLVSEVNRLHRVEYGLGSTDLISIGNLKTLAREKPSFRLHELVKNGNVDKAQSIYQSMTPEQQATATAYTLAAFEAKRLARIEALEKTLAGARDYLQLAMALENHRIEVDDSVARAQKAVEDAERRFAEAASQN